MAIDQGTSTLTISSQERTWRVNIETPMGADPTITIWRETVKTASDGSIISKEQSAVVTRSLSAVIAQTVTVPGTSVVLTLAQLAETIAETADMWREADITAAVVPTADIKGITP